MSKSKVLARASNTKKSDLNTKKRKEEFSADPCDSDTDEGILSDADCSLSEAESFSESDSEISEEEAAEHQEEQAEEQEDDEHESSETNPANKEVTQLSAEEKLLKKKADKAEQKRLRLERKNLKPNFELLQSCKQTWNEVRCKNLDKSVRDEKVAKLVSLLSNNFRELILKHDGSRIVQTCIKYGTEKHRYQILQELTGVLPEVSKNKYGKHIVSKLLLYCPDKREQIVGEFFGKVEGCLKNRDSADILDMIYKNYCNSKKRNMLIREFYGREYAIFKDDKGSEGIVNLFERSNLEKREAILKNLHLSITGFIEKKVIDRLIVHRSVLEYVSHASTKQVQEFVPHIIEEFCHLTNSPEGSRAAIKIIALSTAKERKSIIKSVKEILPQLVHSESGSLVVLALFHLIDDTVLVNKALVSIIMPQIPKLFEDKVSRKVILYLIGGANSQYLSPQAMQSLSGARKDASAAQTSKKDDQLRLKELQTPIIDDIHTFVSENIDKMFANLDKSQIIVEILAYHRENPLEAVDLLKKYVGRMDEQTIFNNSTYCEIIKRILKRTNQDCAKYILDLMQGKIKAHLSTQAGFILLPIVQFPELAKVVGEKYGQMILDSKCQVSPILISRLNLQPLADPKRAGEKGKGEERPVEPFKKKPRTSMRV